MGMKVIVQVPGFRGKEVEIMKKPQGEREDYKRHWQWCIDQKILYRGFQVVNFLLFLLDF